MLIVLTALSSDVLKFDNSHSWTRSKEVYYSVKVLPPDMATPPTDHLSSASDDEFFDCDDDDDDNGLQMNSLDDSDTLKTGNITSITRTTPISTTV